MPRQGRGTNSPRIWPRSISGRNSFFLVTSLVAWPFPTKWGSLDRGRVQDYPELYLLENEMVRRMEAIMVLFLKDLLWGDVLVALSHKHPPVVGKFFSLSYLIWFAFWLKGLIVCYLVGLSFLWKEATTQRPTLAIEDRKEKQVLFKWSLRSPRSGYGS